MRTCWWRWGGCAAGAGSGTLRPAQWPAPAAAAGGQLAEARGSAAEIRRREGEAILAALPAGAVVVALDLGDDAAPTTEALAALLTRWQESGRGTAFVIGGAEGLDPPCSHAPITASLSVP